MNRRTFLGLAAATTLDLGILSGCGSSATTDAADGGGTAALKVVCTSYAAYDWARNIVANLSDHYQLTYLLTGGVDLHSYQPTVADVAAIKECDLFVCVGGESERWVQDALSDATNPNQQVVSLLEALGTSAVEEEVVEGMQADGDEEDEDGAYDEHVWLSLRNAQTLVDVLCDALVTLDGAHEDDLRANAEAYDARLAELDGRYQQAVAGAAHDTLLFADRFPFRYLVDDYGLGYYAAFVGCSAETEASFETMRFLSDRLVELGLPAVLVLENSDQSVARTVIDTAGRSDCPILVLDSLQSVSDDDVAAGVGYLETMEDNLSVLQQALD